MSDFATTRWSMVLAAGRDGHDRGAALARLCEDYWRPLHAYVKRTGRGPEEARDLTQEFFARLLEKGWLDDVEREGGRFRSFLLCALRRLMIDQRKHSVAAKRGGGEWVLSFDWTTAEGGAVAGPACKDETPERAFDRRWAWEVMHRAMERLQSEAEAARKTEWFAALRPYLASEPEAGDYERVGAFLGLSSNAVAAAVRRLRMRYRELFRTVVADTLVDASKVDEEVAHLLAALRPL